MNTARPLLLKRPGFFAWQGGGEGRRGRRNRPARRRQKKRDAGREWRAAAARRHRTKKTHNGRPDAGAGEGLLSAACLPANEEAVGRPPPGRSAFSGFSKKNLNFFKKPLTNPYVDGNIYLAPALVAQLDRVSDYESEGREFESLPAHQEGHPKGCPSFFVSRNISEG